MLVLTAACGTESEEDSFEALEARCAAQVDRSGCESVDGYVDASGASSAACLWETLVPVSLDGDTCVFGEVEGRCTVHGVSGPGCATPTVACVDPEAGGRKGAVRTSADGRRLVSGNVCVEFEDAQACEVRADGTVLAGDPTCACFCDPALPA